MSERPRTKAIIVGGGIGGLSTAIALRRAGSEVVVCERMSELRELGAGLTVWTNAVRALDKLGVADAARARGAEIDRIDQRTERGADLGEIPLYKIARKYGWPSIGIHRGNLLSVLAGALDDGVRVRCGAAFTSFEEDAGGVTVRLEDGTDERGDLLVGADGLRSAVRQQLHGDASPSYSGYFAWRANSRVTDFPERTLIQVYGPGAIFGAMPIEPGLVSWYASTNSPENRGDAPGGRKQEALKCFKGWPAPVEALIDAVDDSEIVRNDLYDRPAVHPWGKGRVTLVGDAAHPTTPSLGQGGCMAIEDGVVLGRCVSQASDIPSALRQFERERAVRTASIVKRARFFGAVHHWENPLACWVRDLFMFKWAPERAVMGTLEDLLGYEAA